MVRCVFFSYSFKRSISSNVRQVVFHLLEKKLNSGIEYQFDVASDRTGDVWNTCDCQEL